MGKGSMMNRMNTIITILCSLGMAIPGKYANILSMPSSYSGPDQDNPVEEWFQSGLNQTREKSVKLHFYVQDIVSGENRSVWEVAESEQTPSSPSYFGMISMADNLVTAGPEAESEIVGRAQGLIGFADMHDIAINMVVSIVFTEGKYKGSTINILGRNLLSEKQREVPIVGGTGFFRLARGIALTNTYSSFHQHVTYEVLEYTLYVFYY